MRKKKSKNHVIRDVTINDSANSVKPVRSIKKAAPPPEEIMIESWDDINNDTEIVEEIADDGSKKLLRKKKQVQEIPTDEQPGIEYPEIVFYLISRYIKPETIGKFAEINKAAYAATKNKSFWMLQFKRHCEKHPKLPKQLLADSYKAYGLRHTVIRSLYHTYHVFVERARKEDIKLRSLVSRVCVNTTFTKGYTYWTVSFKLKKRQLRAVNKDKDFIEELGRIDANPEEGAQVLIVTCKSFQDLPPLMGMTLTSVNMLLSEGYRSHKLCLGFNTSQYAIKGIVPEREVILDAVVGTLICDWWHPQYPYSSILIPRHKPPLLRHNFFDDEYL